MVNAGAFVVDFYRFFSSLLCAPHTQVVDLFFTLVMIIFHIHLINYYDYYCFSMYISKQFSTISCMDKYMGKFGVYVNITKFIFIINNVLGSVSLILQCIQLIIYADDTITTTHNKHTVHNQRSNTLAHLTCGHAEHSPRFNMQNNDTGT